MDLTNAMQGGDRITKQRNLFLLFTILLAVTSSALSLKILMQEERIITKLTLWKVLNKVKMENGAVVAYNL